jgi:hypothetical protein
VKYLSLNRLTIKKLQLIRTALKNYEDGIDHLKQWNIDQGEFDTAVVETKSFRHKIEELLDLHHADYQYKVGKSEPKPLR